LPLQAADLLASYVRQKYAADARGEEFRNVIWDVLTADNGPANLSADLTTEALVDLRRRILASNG
ncbi:MAG TPA: hypothetical protein VMD75_01795, partial [Candidatus Binataceae bacterium]|nr:hypothetical protein [Candidatus Binataceae bacterium]